MSVSVSVSVSVNVSVSVSVSVSVCAHVFFDLPQWFHIFLLHLLHIYTSYIYMYLCYHETTRTPQHSKWNCVGTNRPRHIHMNAPKIRILQKKIFATTKFEFESANQFQKPPISFEFISGRIVSTVCTTDLFPTVLLKRTLLHHWSLSELIAVFEHELRASCIGVERACEPTANTARDETRDAGAREDARAAAGRRAQAEATHPEALNVGKSF